jgi:putative transposase
MPWGIHIGFDPPSVHTLGQIIRNGILPKTYVRKKVEAGEWADIENDWTAYGRPKAIRLDRALENISDQCDIIAQSVGILEVERCEGRRPQQKGAVERFIGSLNRKLLH